MRIYDKKDDKTMRNIALFLTFEEMSELRDSIQSMLDGRMFGSHEHIDDSNYEHEITIAMYKENERNSDFSERANRVLIDDE